MQFPGYLASLFLDPGFGPFAGSIVGALISGLFILWAGLLVARRFTHHIKQVETTVATSQRFHELLDLEYRLNQEFDRRRPGGAELDPETDAKLYYRHFFDLQLNQYTFFLDDLIEPVAFIAWMNWRRVDYRQNENVAGMPYSKGWEYWKGREGVWDEGFVKLFDLVHKASSTEDVNSIVAEHYKRRTKRHLKM